MTEEIKEILDNLYRYKDEDYMKYQPEDILTIEDVWLLLNCITNPQQDLDKANDIIEKGRQFYKCRMDEYVELKKKNEELNRMCELYSKSLYNAELTDYKSRFEKTIEYINFVINHYKEQLETSIEDTYFNSDVNRKGYILSIIAYLQTILDTLNRSDEK